MCVDYHFRVEVAYTSHCFVSFTTEANGLMTLRYFVQSAVTQLLDIYRDYLTSTASLIHNTIYVD